MAAKKTINTPAGSLRVFDKSIKFDPVAYPLFFGRAIQVEDLPATFLPALADMLRAAYRRGKEAKASEIRAKFKVFNDAINGV